MKLTGHTDNRLAPQPARWRSTVGERRDVRPAVHRGPHALAMTTVYPRFSTLSTPPNVSTISGMVCTGILVTK